jgi:transcriptional regulator with XRE-family HTH domain
MSDAQRLSGLRALLGWTQDHAALQLGVSVRTVSRWETGRAPIPRVVLSLLDLLAERKADSKPV